MCKHEIENNKTNPPQKLHKSIPQTSLFLGSVVIQSTINSRICPNLSQRHRQSSRVEYFFSVTPFSMFFSFETTPQLATSREKVRRSIRSKRKIYLKKKYISSLSTIELLFSLIKPIEPFFQRAFDLHF